MADCDLLRCVWITCQYSVPINALIHHPSDPSKSLRWRRRPSTRPFRWVHCKHINYFISIFIRMILSFIWWICFRLDLAVATPIIPPDLFSFSFYQLIGWIKSIAAKFLRHTNDVIKNYGHFWCAIGENKWTRMKFRAVEWTEGNRQEYHQMNGNETNNIQIEWHETVVVTIILSPSIL